MSHEHYTAIAAAIALIEDAYTRGVCAKAVVAAYASNTACFDCTRFYSACNALVA